MSLVLNPVDASQQHGGKSEVRIRGGIRETHLDTASLGIGNPRNADGRGAVAGGVREVHGRFKAWHQALIAVSTGIGEGVDGAGMFDDAADVVEGDVGQAAVLLAGKEGLAL